MPCVFRFGNGLSVVLVPASHHKYMYVHLIFKIQIVDYVREKEYSLQSGEGNADLKWSDLVRSLAFFYEIIQLVLEIKPETSIANSCIASKTQVIEVFSILDF